MKGPIRPANKRARHLLVTLTMLLIAACLPQEAAAQWGAEARAQMGFGGDELISVEYSDGSESSLYLGKYLSIDIGPVYQAWTSGLASLELQALIGWSTWSTGPQKTDDRLRLSRIPVELLAFYGFRLPQNNMLLRIGAGPAFHLATRVRGSGSLKSYRADFNNSVGFTGEMSTVVGTFSAGIRYTSMDATFKRATSTLDASSVGLFVGITTAR